MLSDLAATGAIDQETLLNNLEFPDVQEIVDKTRAQKIIEQKRTEDPRMPAGVNQELLALAENEMLSEGNPVPVDPEMDDHELHIAIHANASAENPQLIQSHIQEHRRAQQGGGMPINPPAPQQVPMPMEGGAPPPPPQQALQPQEMGVPVPPEAEMGVVTNQ